VPVQRHAREVLEEWLATREQKKGPLFTTRTGKRLSRTQLFLILQRVANQASAHLSAGERIKVSPHVLRHTFLRKLAEEKGVQYAKEASGHKSDRYIWRYVKPNQQSLAAAIDEMTLTPDDLAFGLKCNPLPILPPSSRTVSDGQCFIFARPTQLLKNVSTEAYVFNGLGFFYVGIQSNLQGERRKRRVSRIWNTRLFVHCKTRVLAGNAHV
jgi:hypothetical protein